MVTQPLTEADPVTGADGRAPAGRMPGCAADQGVIARQLRLPCGPQPTRWVEELADVAGWRADARCRGLGTDLFFPVGEVGPEAVEHAAAAKTVCRSCSVREPCLEFSLATNQEFGVWGGLNNEERRSLRRAPRRRGTGTGAPPAGADGALG